MQLSLGTTIPGTILPLIFARPEKKEPEKVECSPFNSCLPNCYAQHQKNFSNIQIIDVLYSVLIADPDPAYTY